MSLKVGKLMKSDNVEENGVKSEAAVLILGAGRVCRPAAEFLTSIGRSSSKQVLSSYTADYSKEKTQIDVIVASLYLKDAEEVSQQLNILISILPPFYDVLLLNDNVIITSKFIISRRS